MRVKYNSLMFSQGNIIDIPNDHRGYKIRVIYKMTTGAREYWKVPRMKRDSRLGLSLAPSQTLVLIKGKGAELSFLISYKSACRYERR